MTIFSRYVFRQALSALLLILVSLTGMVWISLALRELNVVTSSGQSAFTLLKLTTLGLPGFVAVIAPFALLIAIIHTLNRLSSDSEIIVLTASGSTAWTLTRPIMVLALIASLGVSVLNHSIMPWSLKLMREMMIAIRTDLLTQVIQPGKFSSPEKGLTFHIRERALNGELGGLIVHDLRDPKQAQSYLSEKAVIVEQDGATFMVMTTGHILRKEVGNAEPAQIIAFDTYAVDLDQFEKRDSSGGRGELKPRERYTWELQDIVAKDDEARAQGSSAAKEAQSKAADAKGKKRKIESDTSPARMRAELHERFANSLYPLAFAMLAVAMIGQAQSTRQNRSTTMAACFALGTAARLAGLACNNLVVINPKTIPLLYVIPIIVMLLSAVVIVRGLRPRRGPSLIDGAMGAIGTALVKLQPKRFAASAPSGGG